MEKMLKVSSVFVKVAGVFMLLAGVYGAIYTYNSIARENIITPQEAAISSASVRGPLTLKAQADIIRVHTLKATGGQVFADMPRSVPHVDDKGKQVLGKDGKPVMVDNAARNIWVTATTLTTALDLGILTYAFSAFVIFMGLVMIGFGYILCKLSQQFKTQN